jgi:general stress protein 26
MRNPPRSLPMRRHWFLGQATALVGWMMTATTASGQATVKTPPDLARVARSIMLAAKYATLATLDETKGPRTRMVQPQPPDSLFTVWFATNPRTRKVRDIARDGRVVMHYFDPVREGYVSLIGRGRVVRDLPTKLAHWDPAWDAFYKSRDTSVVLIEVRADRLEIVSDKDGVTGDQATWQPPVLTVRRRR